MFKDSSKSIVRGVCNYAEGQGLIWKSKNWGGGKGTNQGGKGVLLWIVPVEWSVFLGKARERANNVGVIFNKVSVKIAKTEEGLNLFECFWDWPFCNGFYFDRVHVYASFCDENTEVFNFQLVKGAFLRFQEEVVGFKTSKDFMGKVVEFRNRVVKK